MRHLFAAPFLALTLFILTTSANATVAQMIEVEVEGTKYNVMTIFGSFNGLESQLKETPWWNDEMLAEAFATEVGKQLGLPNFGIDGPWFAYDYPNGMGQNSFACLFSAPNECEIGPLTPPADFQGYYAKASIVPIPAAAWLFASGLIGLVWKGRKAR